MFAAKYRKLNKGTVFNVTIKQDTIVLHLLIIKIILLISIFLLQVLPTYYIYVLGLLSQFLLQKNVNIYFDVSVYYARASTNLKIELKT